MQESLHAEYRADTDHWWFAARRTIFDRLLSDVVDARPGAALTILDIGPGSGVNLPILAPRGSVTVLDFDTGSLQACGRAGAARLVRGDAVTPPLAPQSFDLICALDVLEHLDDDARALAAWRTLLRPQGRLLLSVPALRMLWGRQDVLSQHRRRYRRGELRARMVGAGLQIDRLTYFNSLLLPPIAAARLLMRPFLGKSVAKGRSDLAVRAPFGLDGLLRRTFALESRWLPRHDLPLGVSLLAVARAS